MANILKRVFRKVIRVGQRFAGKPATSPYYWGSAVDEAFLDQEAATAVTYCENFHRSIKALGVDVNGKDILELGPGRNLGPLLIFSAMGAKIWTADRFPLTWRDDYHPGLYQRVRKLLIEKKPEISVEPIDRVLKAKSHAVVGQFLALPCENLKTIPTGAIDITLSNAVFEHLTDPLQSFRELARVTRPGGIGAHQVDFRYHPSFDRPLEHLLQTKAEFQKTWNEQQGSCGCQWRSDDQRAMLQEVGFDVVRYDANNFATEAYLDEFLPRLKATDSPYKNWSREKLRDVGGNFLIKKR